MKKNILFITYIVEMLSSKPNISKNNINDQRSQRSQSPNIKQKISDQLEQRERSHTEIVNELNLQNSSLFVKHDKNPYINNINEDIVRSVKELSITKIPEEESNKFIVNTTNDRSKTIINFQNDRVTVYDGLNKLIGSFTTEHMLKYFADKMDFRNQFLSNLDQKEYMDAKILVKNFIGKGEYDKTARIPIISLYSHEQSPLMGDIEVLMKINNSLHQFEKNKLHQELEFIDKKYRYNVETALRMFIYYMIVHTLGIIDMISRDVSVQLTPGMKQNLIKYAASLTFRVAQFVQNQIKIVNKRNEELKRLIIISSKLKTLINNKIDNVRDKVNKQNLLLEKIANKGYNMSGGYEEYSNSESSSETPIVTFNSSSSEDGAVNLDDSDDVEYSGADSDVNDIMDAE